MWMLLLFLFFFKKETVVIIVALLYWVITCCLSARIYCFLMVLTPSSILFVPHHIEMVILDAFTLLYFVSVFFVLFE